jgi:Ca2+-binding EF-hand superfamily protein
MIMQKIFLGSIAAGALAAATVAFAQPAPVAQPAPSAMPVRMLQPQTRGAVVDKVRAHFAQLDTNRDGYLTKAEAEAGRAGMMAHHGQRAGRGDQGQRPHRDDGAMFDRLDTNRDGAISREEFMSTHQQREAVRGQHGGRGMHMGMGGRMFEQADANHDSRVSLQEATEAALQHFDTADSNRDGTLTPEERRQMHMRMKEMHRVARPI